MNKIFFLFVFLPMMVFSQSKTITGSVTDDGGLPIPGVTILVKNSKNLGVATDFDGNFSITIPSNQTKILVFSYLGYATQEVTVSNTTNVNLIMIPDQTQLDEVVVVGYGTVLKKDVTGSLTSVKVKDNVANQSGTIDQLLQGRAAGVQVTQNAGAPGSGISVKIRGTNSLRGNNEPLYVVDGVIISSAGEDVIAAGGVGNSGQETQNGLNGINPRDIESIQVLKDASATAIYGSRGANGVVLITTKKGVKGKVKINSFTTTSIRTIDKKYDVLDGIGYANYQNEMALLNGLNPRFQIDGSQIFG
ncbi:MAG: carboxypeptidase-like regulatory domain-containing protein, partial [Flavobacteriales bacterium]